MSAPDTTLQLGPFTFQGVEIPTEISGGGNLQVIAKHRFLGGDRVLDAMGVDYAPISWSGLFLGAGALTRMESLKALCSSGLPQTLSWHTFNYTVLILSFEPVERRQYEIPYRITCEVVQDNVDPAYSVNHDVLPDINDAMSQGLSDLEIITDIVANQALSAQVTLIANAISQVEDFQSITAALVGLIHNPLNAAQAIVTGLIAGTDLEISADTGFGGVTQGETAITLSQGLIATQSALQYEGDLFQVQSTLGVLNSNLNSIGLSPNTLAVAGGTLFSVAALEYGDPLQWTAIAAANNLTDPTLPGPIVLNIPLNPPDSGGVLN